MKNALVIDKELSDFKTELKKVRVKFARVCFEEMTQEERMKLHKEASDTSVELFERIVEYVREVEKFMKVSPNPVIINRLEEVYQIMIDSDKERKFSYRFVI